MGKKYKLSICIPTYNRCYQVITLVKSILECPSYLFQIVVLDNKSTDGTYEELCAIHDSRLSVFQNKINIGGQLNPLIVFLYAQGEFSLLCLDKESINVDCLSDFLELMTPSVFFGYCELNIQEKRTPSYYTTQLECLLNFSYLSRHPSGVFYRTDLLMNSSKYNYYIKGGQSFPFAFDIINAEFSSQYAGIVIRLPLIITEKPNIAAGTKSFTYSSVNLFFLPEERIKVCTIYLEHLFTLKLPKKTSRRLITEVLYRTLLNVTVGFKSQREDVYVCNHYGIPVTKVSRLTFLPNYFKFLVQIVKFFNSKKRIFDSMLYIIYMHNRCISTCIRTLRKKKEE